MALPYRGFRSSQDIRWIPTQTFLHRFHKEDQETSQSHMLRQKLPPESHPQENDGNHAGNRSKVHSQGTSQDFVSTFQPDFKIKLITY